MFLKTLFNGVELILLTDIFRQKVALVYQVALSKNVIKHDSPAFARVDWTKVLKFWSLFIISINAYNMKTYLQLIMLLFGLEQKYFRTPSVSFSPYSTLKFSLNWKVIDFVIHAKTGNRSNKQVKCQIQVLN